MGVIGFDCDVEAENSVSSDDVIITTPITGETKNGKVINLAAHRTPALALAA